MAVYIELVTEPFDAQGLSQSKDSRIQMQAGLVSARRPTRGLEVKDDTYAYIKLIRVDGVPIEMFDSSAPGGMSEANSNFILQSVAEQRMEKNQVVDTFGDAYLYLFGEAPRFLQISAMLIDSLDFNWRAEFMANYETYLRGTRAVELGARTYLFYKDNIVEGYILNCSISESADQPHIIPLQFQFFVTNAQNISLVGEGSENYPIRESAVIPEDIDLTVEPGGETLDKLMQSVNGPYDKARVDRTSPIRSFILDNTDEYAGQAQPNRLDSPMNRASERYLQGVGGIHLSISLVLGAYGVSAPFDPFLMNDIGIGPIFTRQGIGIGSFAGQSGQVATFGAVASLQGGAFAGGGRGIGAQYGMAGPLGLGAYNGYSAPNGFGSTTVKEYSASYDGKNGLQTSSREYSVPNQLYNTSPTARGGMFVSGARPSAFAFQQGNLQSSRFAATNTRQAARAGGYAGAGAYLGNAYGGMPFASGSFAGAQGGSGGSVHVGGNITAFSFVAAKGSLVNQTLPPAQAIAYRQPDFAYSKSFSWPNGS